MAFSRSYKRLDLVLTPFDFVRAYSPLHLPHHSHTLPRQDLFLPRRPLPQEMERASVGIRLPGGEAGHEHGRSRKGRWGRDGRQGGRREGGGCGCRAWSSALATPPNEP